MAAKLMGWDGNDHHCRVCNGMITPFVDGISIKEFYLSGRCQDCQDEFYNRYEEESYG